MMSTIEKLEGVRRVHCAYNSSLPECQEAAAILRSELEARGFEVEMDCRPSPSEPPDVLVILGGDGFLTETLRSLGYPRTPVFGLNFGSVGFLMNQRSWLPQLPSMLQEGRFIREEHCVLAAHLRLEDGSTAELFAVNDVVVERMTRQSLRLNLFLDGVLLNHYAGDGVIVSTTAGSTAYNLAARGPVVHPSLDVLVVTPLYPHRASPFHSMQFSLVVPQTSTIRVAADDLPKRRMRAVGDGESVEGVESVEVRDSGRRVALLRPVSHVFVKTLSSKFIGE